MPLSAGDALGPYEIVAPLGSGGMGEVYRARDTRLGRDVALKILTDHFSPDARGRFEREVRAASALSHPHIAAVYDVGKTGEHVYFVMELVDGVTLRDYVQGRRLDPAEVIAIGGQVADALEAAHAKGVIHRDVKPGNIMITGGRYVKVLDFGLARQLSAADDMTLEPLTKAGSVMGTPQYISPEVLQGLGADARGDVWALGVVLYELLAGHPPFDRRTSFEMSADILREPIPALPASVPAGLRAIVERCLEKQPERRYQHANEVRAALNAITLPSAVSVAGPRRTWAVWAAAIAITVVAGGALMLRSRPAVTTERRTSTGAPASSNQEANEAFELAMNFQRVQNNLARSQPLLERAIALDPHFAEALRYHAINNIIGLLNGFTNDTSVLYKAEQELQNVSSEAPSLVSLPSALTTLYLMQGRRELVPMDALERVHSENPSHRDTSFWRAILTWLDGNNSAAGTMLTEILQREPLWGPPRVFLGDVLRIDGDIQGAVREGQKVLEQAPDNLNAIRLLVHASLDVGDTSRARQLVESKRETFAKNYMWKLMSALVMAGSNQRADARATLDEDTLKFAGAAFVVTLDVAEVYALLGDVDRAVEWLDRAVRNGDERVAWFRKDPRLAAIRTDGRFQRILESIDARQKTRRQQPS